MITGKNNQWFWIEWRENNKFLGDLISEFQQIVLGKYLVNTSFDSGSLRLDDKEIAQSWRQHNELALSPQIADIESIPHDQYDEWYVSYSPEAFNSYEVFINYGGFSLSDPAFVAQQERFWQQMNHLSPESYLAEGDFLICVTKNSDIFDLIINSS